MAAVLTYSHGWQCPACGLEQTEDQRVTRAGPIDPDPDRATCRYCGVTSVLEFDFAPDVGVSVDVRPVVPS